MVCISSGFDAGCDNHQVGTLIMYRSSSTQSDSSLTAVGFELKGKSIPAYRLIAWLCKAFQLAANAWESHDWRKETAHNPNCNEIRCISSNVASFGRYRNRPLDELISIFPDGNERSRLAISSNMLVQSSHQHDSMHNRTMRNAISFFTNWQFSASISLCLPLWQPAYQMLFNPIPFIYCICATLGVLIAWATYRAPFQLAQNPIQRRERAVQSKWIIICQFELHRRNAREVCVCGSIANNIGPMKMLIEKNNTTRRPRRFSTRICSILISNRGKGIQNERKKHHHSATTTHRDI